jgi:flagellar basal body-associated protein FliL
MLQFAKEEQASMPMMFGMMLWMPIMMLLFIVLVVMLIWLLVRWSNKQKTPTTLYTPPRQNSYEQPDQSYQEGGEQHHYPQREQEYNQPQISYPEQQMPGRH